MSISSMEVEARIAAARRHGGDPYKPQFRNIGALLAARVAEAPDREALAFFDDDAGMERRWTWGQLATAVGRSAAFLAGAGVGRGDRVAFLLGNLDHTVILYLATWSLGACVAPVNAAEDFERKHFIVENSGATILFAKTEYFEDAQRLRDELSVRLVEVNSDAGATVSGAAYPQIVAGEDTALPESDFDAVGCEALLIYTSGTTGAPKGVRVDQYNMMADAASMIQWHAWSASLTTMCVLPIHHVNGIIVTLVTPFLAGGRAILNSRFNSRTFWQRVGAESVNIVSVVPTLLEFLVEADRGGKSVPRASECDISSLRTILCGAGPLLVETALAFEQCFGVSITHGYGLSETTCYNCHLPPDLSDTERRAWLSEHGFPSIGPALPWQEMAILDGDDRPVAEGVRGEICIRGDAVSMGYYRRPEANISAFKNGWFHSGDEGFAIKDAGGRDFFFITGRIKELIIRGGINYAPLEIDEALCTHPHVRYGLAVPFPNRYYGDEIAAYVVPEEGVSPDAEDIIQHARKQLGFSKSPKVIIFGEEVPYTSTGKPRRIELARQLEPQLAEHRATQFRKP